MSKKQEIAALKEVLSALLDNDNKVLVETVTARTKDGQTWSWDEGNEGRFIVPRKDKIKVYNSVAAHANSFKVGKDISVRRVRGKWVVRTSKYEVTYDVPTEELEGVLAALRGKYNGDKPEFYLYRLNKYCPNKELKDFVKSAMEKKATKSKYDKAIENLKNLGVKPDRLMDYIKKNNIGMDM